MAPNCCFACEGKTNKGLNKKRRLQKIAMFPLYRPSQFFFYSLGRTKIPLFYSFHTRHTNVWDGHIVKEPN